MTNSDSDSCSSRQGVLNPTSNMTQKESCRNINVRAYEIRYGTTRLANLRGVAAPNGYFVSKQEDDVAGGAAFGSWVDMMIALAGECH